MYLESSAESSWVEVSCLTSPRHNYQDERFCGVTMYNNKYIWQNTFNKAG